MNSLTISQRVDDRARLTVTAAAMVAMDVVDGDIEWNGNIPQEDLFRQASLWEDESGLQGAQIRAASDRALSAMGDWGLLDFFQARLDELLLQRRLSQARLAAERAHDQGELEEKRVGKKKAKKLPTKKPVKMPVVVVESPSESGSFSDGASESDEILDADQANRAIGVAEDTSKTLAALGEMEKVGEEQRRLLDANRKLLPLPWVQRNLDRLEGRGLFRLDGSHLCPDPCAIDAETARYKTMYEANAMFHGQGVGMIKPKGTTDGDSMRPLRVMTMIMLEHMLATQEAIQADLALDVVGPNLRSVLDTVGHDEAVDSARHLVALAKGAQRKRHILKTLW